MEQALEGLSASFFDGFVGSNRPFFDQQAIEDDKLPDRWARLWKLHGSINWRFNQASKTIIRSLDRKDGDELLIHPSHRKYDESRRMPYLVLIDRLKTFLRNDKQPVVLFFIGHSLSDQHLNATVLESLKANPSSACFVLLFGNLSDYPAATALAKNETQLSVIGKDGAILRGREHPWIARPTTEISALGGAFDFADDEKEEDSDEPRPCSFLLGDFKKFGEFIDEVTGQNPTPDKEL